MKLENINDVLKENMSKDCRIYYLASCILDCDEYSNLYESCSNYDEFEKRVLNEDGKTYFIYVPAPYYHFDDYAQQDKHYCYGFIYLEGHAVLAVYRDKWHMETNECNPHGRWMKIIRSNRDLISVGGIVLALKKGVPDNEDFDYYETFSCFSKVDEPFDTLFPNMDSNKIYGIEKDAEGNHILMKYEIRECGVWPNYFKVLDDEQETGKSDE